MDRTVIANATILDGSGDAPFAGDVLVEGQRIVAVQRGGFGTFAGRVQVDTNIVWHKLRALVEGAALASRALW